MKNVMNRIKKVLGNQTGSVVTEEGVKMIIAIVLGGLLIAGVSALIDDSILPTIKEKILGMFGS